MMTYIEQVLQEKSLNSEQHILMAQWEFDKKNIPNTLNAIINVFPHYSLHNETHSCCILSNIVKMIGVDAIKQMSCTDLWLLLESAYCHDIGMVITSNELQEAIENKLFLNFYMTIACDVNHQLYKYTLPFELTDNNKIVIKQQELNASVFDSAKFLLAEYLRTTHAQRSKKKIENPMLDIGLDSPRSGIPPRLFHIMGEICEAHTKEFDYVQNLPTTEDGIGLEEAHPMFIACLLRLGDLLDVDNLRFSETLLKTLKEVPQETILHKDKHESISHLSINNKYIEIEAHCPSPQVALVTRDWFNWITEEINVQTKRWNKIVPECYNCHIPIINFLKIKIDKYNNIAEENDQRFNIDISKAIELLQGKNFYKNEFDAIREIIQNAVDSTLIRIYIDARKEKKKFDGIHKDFIDFARNYPITVSIKEENGGYRLTVSDKGIGLKRTQLQYLTNTGSSSNNVEKAIIINEMPKWMRPSGVFGIGFQSVFLLTDLVDIKTKDYFDGGKMVIEMHSPNGPMHGSVFLKNVEDDIDTGFSISFIVNKEIDADKDVIMDTFNALHFDFKRAAIENRIKLYGEYSFIPIIIKWNEEKNDTKIERHEDSFDFFDKENNIELKFPIDSFNMEKLHFVKLLYRNAPVGSHVDIMFIHPVVNVHFGNAKNLLELNRNSFKKVSAIRDLIIQAILNFTRSDKYRSFLDDIRKQDDNKARMAEFLFSFFVESYETLEKTQDDFQLNNDIKEFPIQFKNRDDEGGSIEKELKIKDILNKQNVIFDYRPSNRVLDIAEPDDKENTIIVYANSMPIGVPSFFADISKLIFTFLCKSHKHSFCQKRIRDRIFEGAVYKFTNDEINDGFDKDIELTAKTAHDFFTNSSAPHFVNYIKGYDKIRIPSNKCDDKINVKFAGDMNLTQNLEKILSPFLIYDGNIFDGRNNEFYDYVCKQTGNAKEEIVKEYDNLIEDFEKNVENFRLKNK